MWHIFYRNAHGAFVIFDLTDLPTFDCARETIEEIRHYRSDDLFIMLIGTKSDSTSRRLITYEQAITLAEKYGLLYMETSALNGSNVEKSFILLIKGILANNTTRTINTRLSHLTNIATSSRQVSKGKMGVSCNIQ
ncbi:unnamed protein product [Rotaria sp. Silwood1]|nr:unnamed protein product [Rotaria sp. Silwood1]CAF4898183.1 unnamed protein product [Rotaria sp. Silwood1]